MKLDRSQLLTRASKVYEQFSCLPHVTQARLRRAACGVKVVSPLTLSLEAKWSHEDSVRRDRISVTQDYLLSAPSNKRPKLLYTSPQNFSSMGTCFPYSGQTGCKVLWDIEYTNPDTKYCQRAIFVESKLPVSFLGDSESQKASSAHPGIFVHVYSDGIRTKTIKLPTEKKGKTDPVHGRVYCQSGSSTPFSSCSFSPNGQKIMYLAEYVVPSGKSVEEEDIISVPLENSPFVYRENWGEALASVTKSVICILDLDSEQVECLQTKLQGINAASKNWSSDSPLWIPDGKGIVFLAFDSFPFQLGLIYCFQRPSSLIYWNFENDKIQCLSREQRAVRWPSFSPDKSKLIWFEMPAGGPHNQCFELLRLDWPSTEPKVVIPLFAHPDPETTFPGLFLASGVCQRFWAWKSNVLLLSTCWGSDEVLVVVDLTTDSTNPASRILRIPSPFMNRGNSETSAHRYGSLELLDVLDDVLVVQASSPLDPPFIAIAKLEEGADNLAGLEWLKISAGTSTTKPSFLQGVNYEVIEHTASLADKRFSVTKFESILIYPVGSPTDVKISPTVELLESSKSHPSPIALMVIPHGGPHSSFVTEWISNLSAYVAMGFACLLINYRGSTGYGNASIHCLPGQIGVLDVADCVQATAEARTRLGNLPAVLLGGSHGGFLVLHLAARHGDQFSSVVARNPVSNLMSMIGTSDIPDWCWEEAGLGPTSDFDQNFPEKSGRSWKSNSLPKSPDDLAHLVSCSPINYVSPNWSVPLLMCLGEKDLRVPNNQGIAFVRELRANVGDKADDLCRIIRFPTEAHPIESPAAAREGFLRAVEWFYKSLNLIQSDSTLV